MAETTKVVVLSVELDLTQFSKNADQAAIAIDEIQKKQAVLQVQGKQNTQEYAALSAQLQKTRKDLRDNAAAVQRVSKLQKENTGSIVEMREELAIGTLRWNNLSKAERDNINVGGKLKAQLKSISDELRKNGSAIGDNRMFVGSYEDAIQSALSQTNLFGGGISQLSGILSTGGAFGIAITAAIGLTKLFGDAILSVDSNSDKMQQKLAGAGAALKTFSGGIARSGGGGVTEFLGDFIQAFALIPASLAGMEDEAVDAINITEKLTAATQSLNDAERDASNIISANNVLIDQYIARSKNKAVSDEERIEILKEAGRLEEENLKRQQLLAEARLRIIKVENELNKRQQGGELSDEQKQREADAINEINKLRQESLALQERIQARISAIAEDANKEADDLAKKQTDELIKELREREKALEDADKKERARKEKLQQFLQNIGHKMFVDDYKAILDERKETTELFGQEEELLLKERFANKLITEEQFAQELINLEITRLQSELDLLVANSATEVGLENEIAAKKIEIAIATADAKIKENKRVTENTKEETDKQIKIAQKQADIAEDFIANIGQAFSDSLTEQGLQVESFAKNVLLVVLDTLEKTITASIAAATAESLAQPDSVATFGVTGIARAAVLTGLIRAAFAVVKGQITKDSGAKFAKGGMPGEKGFVIGGKPHSQGGTKFIGSDGSRFEAERDEAMIILNKRATDKMRYYSSLNYNSGGVDFFKGNKPSTYLADGGFAARAVTKPVLDEANAQQSLSNMPPIFVLVEDINSAQGLQAKVKSRSVFP